MSTNAPKMIDAIGPDGQTYGVPEDQWGQAEAAGFKPDTVEAKAERDRIKTFGGVKGMAKAAGAGVLESIPFLGGTLEKHLLGDVSAEKEVNPGSNIGGVAAGAIGQTLATGGLGDAVMGADATEALSVGARALAKAGLGSVEGGIYGAGNAVNQAVLDDHPLTAEYLLANAGAGALFGGTLAGGLSLGSDALGKVFEGAGNAERAAALKRAVSADAKELEDAGLSTKRINGLFKEGVVQSGDSPIQVQSRVTAKLAQVDQGLQELGAKIDASGQTFNVPKLMESAKLKEGSFSSLLGADLQVPDEAAPFARLSAIRASLAKQSGDDASKLMEKIDAEIAAKAKNLDPEIGKQASELLEKRGDLQTLSDLSGEAVRNPKVPAKGDALGALLRQGNHIATWGMLSRIAGHVVGGHVGLGGFLGLSAANVLHAVARNPGRIGELLARGMGGVAKAAGATQGELETAVLAAVSGSSRAAGPVATGIDKLLLPHNPGTSDVERVRSEIASVAAREIPNTNPHLANVTRAHRALLAQALPQPVGPSLPASLSRQVSPSQKMVQRYNETVHALANPIGVIGAVGKGRATQAQLQAIRAGYPNLAHRAASMMLNQAADSKKPVSAHLRRAIEALSGKPLDTAMTPDKVARIQAVFAPAQPPGRAGAKGGQVQVSQTGLSNLDIAGRMNALSQPKGRGQ